VSLEPCAYSIIDDGAENEMGLSSIKIGPEGSGTISLSLRSSIGHLAGAPFDIISRN